MDRTIEFENVKSMEGKQRYDRDFVMDGPMDRVPTVRIGKSDFVKLIYILKKCHSIGLMHRDIKLSNIFFDPRKQQVVLNDWSCAKHMDDSEAFAGCRKLASVKVLKRINSNLLHDNDQYQACDDLEMLVHLLANHSFTTVYDPLYELQNDQVSELERFWTSWR
jgi:serine/threonine protein kinase